SFSVKSCFILTLSGLFKQILSCQVTRQNSSLSYFKDVDFRNHIEPELAATKATWNGKKSYDCDTDRQIAVLAIVLKATFLTRSFLGCEVHFHDFSPIEAINSRLFLKFATFINIPVMTYIPNAYATVIKMRINFENKKSKLNLFGGCEVHFNSIE
ncbi:hypothetical protein BpHYR1_048772, partial [Brachionus plicatilis]